jgi:hypothetical protein
MSTPAPLGTPPSFPTDAVIAKHQLRVTFSRMTEDGKCSHSHQRLFGYIPNHNTLNLDAALGDIRAMCRVIVNLGVKIEVKIEDGTIDEDMNWKPCPETS